MKKCERCGKPVEERTDRDVHFCSIECANKSRRKHFPKPCEFCEKPFQPPSSHPSQKYCSTDCRDNARRCSVDVPCSFCGKTISRKKSRVDTFDTFFCSSGCMGKYRKLHAPVGDRHPQYIERTEYTCDYCGTSVMRLPNTVKTYVFCDIECRLQWQKESGYISGENSPTWLGGHDDGRGANWRKQRRAARKRDGFTCQKCGITEDESGRCLDVHHVTPFRDFNNDWETANQLDNLISLCNKCHLIVEWENGSRSASKAID